MKRLERRAFNTLTAASLVSFLALAWLWASSYASAASTSQIPPGGYRLLNWRGQLILLHHRKAVAPPHVWVMTTAYLGSDGTRRLVLIQGLVRDPAVTLALPATWLRGATRRRHVGLCPVCSYDLRATPSRCPECGREPVKVESRPRC